MFDTKQVIVIRKDLKMRKGKMAAQVAHASMSFLLADLDRTSEEHEWLSGSFAKVVVSVNSEKELEALVHKGREAGIKVFDIVDSGRTEFHGEPTLTCAAFGPAEVSRLDKVTGGLELM